jgi:ATP-dependent Lhr-like helicase
VALESLRAARLAEAGAHGHGPLQPEIVTLSAADPLNLVGIIVPGERVPAVSGKTITLRDGAAITEQPSTPFTAVAGGTDRPV